MRTLAITISLLAASLAFDPAFSQAALTGERALRDECSFDPNGINECLHAKVDQSLTRLREARASAAGHIKSRRVDTGRGQPARTLLAIADDAYARYRHAHCAFGASMGGGAIGHALETGRLACVADLNFRQAGLLNTHEYPTGYVRESVTALDEARRDAIKRLDAWDEDAPYRRLAIARLRALDVPFERYRQAQCEVAAATGGGTIRHPLETRRLGCVAGLNFRQVELIRDLVSDRLPR